MIGFFSPIYRLSFLWWQNTAPLTTLARLSLKGIVKVRKKLAEIEEGVGGLGCGWGMREDYVGQMWPQCIVNMHEIVKNSKQIKKGKY